MLGRMLGVVVVFQLVVSPFSMAREPIPHAGANASGPNRRVLEHIDDKDEFFSELIAKDEAFIKSQEEALSVLERNLLMARSQKVYLKWVRFTPEAVLALSLLVTSGLVKVKFGGYTLPVGLRSRSGRIKSVGKFAALLAAVDGGHWAAISLQAIPKLKTRIKEARKKLEERKILLEEHQRINSAN